MTRVFHGTRHPESVLSGVRMDVPREKDAGDFGWGFYCTWDHRRAGKYGEVLVVDVDLHKFAYIPNPYFLRGLREVEPRTDVEKLFHSIAFHDGVMKNVQAGYDREETAKAIRVAFLEAGYDGIVSEDHRELVVFNPAAVQAVNRIEVIPRMEITHYSLGPDGFTPGGYL
jgi:hypothetical protein